VLHNPEITAGERAWIMPSIDDRLHSVQTECCWLDERIAGESGEEDSSNT
jgi:hypothetical protein